MFQDPGRPWEKRPFSDATPGQSAACPVPPRVRKVVKGLFTFEIGSVVLFFLSLWAGLDGSVMMKAVSQLLH